VGGQSGELRTVVRGCEFWGGPWGKGVLQSTGIVFVYGYEGVFGGTGGTGTQDAAGSEVVRVVSCGADVSLTPGYSASFHVARTNEWANEWTGGVK